MRLFIAALVLILTAASASAAPIAAATATPYRPATRNVQLGTAPQVYSPAQRAMAVQKLLSLSAPPTLGQTITLDASTTYIPQLAQLDIGGVGIMVGGTFYTIHFPSGPVFEINPDGFIQITLRGSAGKQYAIDCRSGGTGKGEMINYNVTGEVLENGSVQPDFGGHWLIATPKLPQDGPVVIYMDFPKTYIGDMNLYGCDISPF